VDDAVNQLLDVSIFEDDKVFEKVQFVDFYRYCDVSMDDMMAYLDARLPWQRPTDTGRSTNCLINQVGIYVHKKERGYSNYAFPYSWDVRMGHKTRDASLDEINEFIEEEEVQRIMDEIGYDPDTGHSADEKHLVAYYTSEASLSQADLRKHLAAYLPDYMIPAHFVQLDQLPLTANGKIDRKALPGWEEARPELAVEYAAPETEIEEMLAEMWEEVLQIDQIGIRDNFIQLGGTSLAAIRLMARINEAFELDLPLNQMFEHPTVEALAAHIEATIETLLAELEGD
jgi:acyl carrier protein